MSQAPRPQIFVVAAQVAAELHFVMKQARSLSLTAKNARVIAVRAGHQASGFNAITDFIETLSTTTISQAQAINQIAIRVSKLAVDYQRRKGVITRLQRVQKVASDAEFIASTQAPFTAVNATYQALRERFYKDLQQLQEVIVEAQLHMRSAKVIATSSKVEANQAGEFEAALMVIAENIETISETIKDHLQRAKTLLDLHTDIGHLA